MHTHTHAHTYTYTHTHACTHVRTYAYVHTYAHTYTYVRTRMHTYTYTHVHIHTHAHTYTHRCEVSSFTLESQLRGQFGSGGAGLPQWAPKRGWWPTGGKGPRACCWGLWEDTPMGTPVRLGWDLSHQDTRSFLEAAAFAEGGRVCQRQGADPQDVPAHPCVKPWAQGRRPTHGGTRADLWRGQGGGILLLCGRFKTPTSLALTGLY